MRSRNLSLVLAFSAVALALSVRARRGREQALPLHEGARGRRDLARGTGREPARRPRGDRPPRGEDGHARARLRDEGHDPRPLHFKKGEWGQPVALLAKLANLEVETSGDGVLVRRPQAAAAKAPFREFPIGDEVERE